MEINEDENGLSYEVKNAQQLVPRELLDDCMVDILDLISNPSFGFKPAAPLTRREKLRCRLSDRRAALAERAYRLIAGHDVRDDFWDY